MTDNKFENLAPSYRDGWFVFPILYEYLSTLEINLALRLPIQYHWSLGVENKLFKIDIIEIKRHIKRLYDK